MGCLNRGIQAGGLERVHRGVGTILGTPVRNHRRRYFLTGERFDAHEARRIGLVHEVVEDADALIAAGERMVARLFAAPPGALAEAKDLIAAVSGRPIDAGIIEDTARRIAARRAHDEAGEGIAAFLEKRKPDWHG